MRQDVYSGQLNLHRQEHGDTLREASNYALGLVKSSRFAEAKSLLCKTMPVARRVLGESYYLTLTMRLNYAMALYLDNSAMIGDLREAVTTLEETARIARRVFGGAHPLTTAIERNLREAQAALGARETLSPGSAQNALTRSHFSLVAKNTFD